MADPKYANLPGIAYDQPDIYETSDLPEADQNNEYYEEDNECIERLHLNAHEAFTKFKGKSLESGAVDFSDRLSRRLRTGYDARSGDWELVAEGEKELPLQKFQRLKCELQELVEEVSQLKETSKDEQSKEKLQSTVILSQLEQTQKQLMNLRLEETLGSELIGNMSDPQGAQLKKLLSQLESFKAPSGGVGVSSPPKQPPSKAAPAPGGKEEAGGGVITYQLSFWPERERLAQSARVANLEHKIHQLESVLGATDNNLGRLSSDVQRRGLLDVAEQLSVRASVLDPSCLDHVEGRLAALAHKMDALGQRAAASPDDPDTARKVNELYELAKKTEAMSHILPQTIERMLALESLHHQAADFSKSLTELEALEQQIKGSLQNNDELLKGVEKSFQNNLETIKKNMNGLNTRIAELKKK